MCNKVTIKDPITPQACRYTTLWISVFKLRLLFHS